MAKLGTRLQISYVLTIALKVNIEKGLQMRQKSHDCPHSVMGDGKGRGGRSGGGRGGGKCFSAGKGGRSLNQVEKILASLVSISVAVRLTIKLQIAHTRKNL